jgi:predicted small lipoprotein YifL
MKYYTLILLIGISLSGCGQKGDLFLTEPDTPIPNKKPVDPED